MQSIYKVEICRDCGYVVNCAVGESGFAQWRKILLGNLLLMKSDLQRA
jgi:hypothetical protein